MSGPDIDLSVPLATKGAGGRAILEAERAAARKNTRRWTEEIAHLPGTPGCQTSVEVLEKRKRLRVNLGDGKGPLTADAVDESWRLGFWHAWAGGAARFFFL